MRKGHLFGAPPPSDVPRLIALWIDLFAAKYGERPIPTGKDAAAVKRLVGYAGAVTVERRLRLYLALDDAYLAAQGYPLSLLSSAWNRLIALDQPDRQRGPDAAATDRYLQGLNGGRR